MSRDGNVGIITSEAALFLKNTHMSLEGNIGGYTSETTSGQMPITSDTPSSVEGGSKCNISEATSGQITPITSETPSSVEGSSGCNTSEATSGQIMPITSETPSSVEGSSGGNTPESSSGHMPIRLSEGTAIQQVLGTLANAEFGHMFVPECRQGSQRSGHFS